MQLMLHSVKLITQCAQMSIPDCPGILEVIMDRPERRNFRVPPKEVKTHRLRKLLNIAAKLSEYEDRYILTSWHALQQYELFAPYTRKDWTCALV